MTKNKKKTNIKKGHDNIPLKRLKLDLKLDKTGNRKYSQTEKLGYLQAK